MADRLILALDRLDARLTVLTWMVGFNLVLTVVLWWRLLAVPT
jgi:hypothetical protein